LVFDLVMILCPAGCVQVRDLLVRLASAVAARSAEGDKVEAALKELSRSGDVGAARAARKAVESSLKDSARQLKALQDELEAAGDAKAAAKVRTQGPPGGNISCTAHLWAATSRISRVCKGPSRLEGSPTIKRHVPECVRLWRLQPTGAVLFACSCSFLYFSA
jgi:hypothetical protein